jgi:hypothetical protein
MRRLKRKRRKIRQISKYLNIGGYFRNIALDVGDFYCCFLQFWMVCIVSFVVVENAIF